MPPRYQVREARLAGYMVIRLTFATNGISRYFDEAFVYPFPTRKFFRCHLSAPVGCEEARRVSIPHSPLSTNLPPRRRLRTDQWYAPIVHFCSA